MRLTKQERKQALTWYAVLGFDLQTIADHFHMTRANLCRELNTTHRGARQ